MLPSLHNIFYHVSMHVGETIVTPLEAVGETFMVDAEAVQDRGVKVVNMHRILCNVVAVVVGSPIGEAGVDAAPAIHSEKQRG